MRTMSLAAHEGRPFLEPLEPRILLSGAEPQEWLWHEVVVRDALGLETGRYDVVITATQDLALDYLRDDFFDTGVVTSIRIADQTGESVTDRDLAESILVAAQNLALVKNGFFHDIAPFVVPEDLTDYWVNRTGYEYRCNPGHADGFVAGLLQVLLDANETRKGYYRTVITELVTQPQRYADVYANGQTDDWLGAALKPAAALTSWTSDTLKVLTTADWHLLKDLVGPVIVMATEDDGTYESLLNSWVPPCAGAQEVLANLQLVFAGVQLYGRAQAGALEAMEFDHLRRFPECKQRFRAIRDFVTDYRSWPHHDQALVEAFDEFAVDWTTLEGNYAPLWRQTLTSLFTDPEAYVDIYNLQTAWESALGGIGAAADLAKGVGWTTVFDWGAKCVGDMNQANLADLSATVGTLLAAYIDRASVEVDLRQPMEVPVADRLSALSSMISYAGYAYYSHLANMVDYQCWNTADWVKYLADAWNNEVGEKYERFTILSEIGLRPESNPWGNQFLRAYEELYAPMLEGLLAPDIEVRSVRMTPAQMEHPGQQLTVEVTLGNVGQLPVYADVQVNFDGARFQYWQTVRYTDDHAAKYLIPGGVETLLMTVPTYGFLGDSYAVRVEAYDWGGGADRNQTNNTLELPYSIGSCVPSIVRDIPDVCIPVGGFWEFDLNGYVFDPDNSLADLSWSAEGQSKIGVEIRDGHVARITSDWAGQEPVTFMVTDPSGGRDWDDIQVSAFQETGLYNGGVDPPSGYKGDAFTFFVDWVSLTGVAPENVWVIVDGLLHDMKYDSGSLLEGARYVFSTNRLVTAKNYFYFQAFDGQRRYRTSVIGGPQLNEVHDLKVHSLSLYPDAPEADDTVEIQARIENLGTLVEQAVVVRLAVNGVAQGDPVTIDLVPGEVSGLISFHYTVPRSDYTENYQLTIEAQAVPGEANTGDNAATTSFDVVPKPGAVLGWVFDQYNIPVEGAVVKVVESDSNSFGSTNADGQYFLDGLMPGTYTLEAYKDGLGKTVFPGVQVHTKETTPEVNFVITPVDTHLVTSGKYLTDTFWFPDGHRLIFGKSVQVGPNNWYKTLVRVQEDGAGIQELAGPDKPVKEFRFGAEVSPDGTKIVLSGAGTDGRNSIWMMTANGTGGDAYVVRSASSTVNYYYPTFSPDGRRIAYHKRTEQGGGYIHQLCIYNLDTAQESVLAVADLNELAWSPDGQWMAANDKVLNAVTGEVVLNKPDMLDPAWLPDTSGIVYTSGGNIWLYRMQSGESLQITFWPEIEYYPAIPRQDGSKLAFSSNKTFTITGDFGIFVQPFEVPSVYLTNVSVSCDPITPNGDGLDDELVVSYTTNKDGYVTLKIHDSQGEFVRTVLNNELQSAGPHAVIWDGKNEDGNQASDEVYFYRFDFHDGTDHAIPVHGRVALVKDMQQIGTTMGCPRWSPDGERIAYINTAWPYTIYTCNANGTGHQLVPTPVMPEAVAWSRTGTQLVFSAVADSRDLAIINLDGTGYLVIDGDTYNVEYPSSSPAADMIVYSIAGGHVNAEYGHLEDFELVRINADGTGRVRLTSDAGQDVYPVWSPDGSKIAWATDRSGPDLWRTDIWLMNADGSGQVQFTYSPYTDTLPAFTPDGKRLLFGSNRQVGREAGCELWTQPLDGSDEPRCLAKFDFGIPSPDGTKILVTNHILELFLSLTKGAIEGQVLDGQTLQPLVGATVCLRQGGVVMTTLTNEQGAYQFWNVEPASYILNAVAEGYIACEDVPVETHPWVVSRGNTLALVRQPSVTFTEIADGATIGSLLTLHSLSEAGDVTSVEYEWRTAGDQWQQIGTAIYSLPAQWDTQGLTSGNYQVRATALDSQGNEDASPDVLNLSIDHTAPHAVMVNPGSGAFVHGKVTVSASCADSDVCAMIFQYRRAGDAGWINIGNAVAQSPWQAEWDTTHLFGIAYELRAVAVDGFGNADGNPEKVTVTVGDLCHWDGLVNDHWENAANWSEGMVPDGSQVAVAEPSPDVYHPRLYKDEAVAGVDFRTEGWTLSCDGHTLTIGDGGIRFAGDEGPASRVDVGTGSVIFNPRGGPSPLADVTTWVRAGLNAPSGYWDGNGITSSAAAAEADRLTAVGILDNADPEVGGKTEFAGQAVDATSVLVKYTWWGDANLDGVVNSNDYDRIDSNWLFYGNDQGTPPGGFRWAVGDFNHDGRIDSNDYDKIDTAWLLSGGTVLGGDDPLPVMAATASDVVMPSMRALAETVSVNPVDLLDTGPLSVPEPVAAQRAAVPAVALPVAWGPATLGGGVEYDAPTTLTAVEPAVPLSPWVPGTSQETSAEPSSLDAVDLLAGPALEVALVA